MVFSDVPIASAGDPATALDTFAYWSLLTVGVLALGLMIGLNVVSIWWVVRKYSRTPVFSQPTEDDPGWAVHATRVVASELELARHRADQTDPPLS